MIDKISYKNIEIPDELDVVINSAIFEGKRLRKKNRIVKLVKRVGVMAACFLLCVISLLNVSPVFAEAAYKIPVIGDLCRIVTFREYNYYDNIKYIDAKIPIIENTGKSDLEKKVNYEIQMKINECLEENESVAKDYYKAFIETGGKPEEFTPVGITIDYEIKSMNESYVSFVIWQYQTAFKSYNHTFYYNIDMESGRIITLKDWFGNDYRKIVSESIDNTISGWNAEQKEILWDDITIIDFISENTDFYINQDNQIVVVFPQYEVACGSAGALEFVIQPAGN